MRIALFTVGALFCAQPPALADPEATAAGEVALTAESHQANFRVVTVAEGLEFPWSLAFLPGGDLLVTERPGFLRRVLADGTVSEPIDHGLDITAIRQGGLMEVSLHPDFENNGMVYLCYATGPEDANFERVARGRLDGDRLVDVEDIWEADSVSARGFHYGCRLVWRDDGTLFITLGDRGLHREASQTPASHFGTVVRIAEDGSVPADNPFNTVYDGPSDEQPLLDVWSYGHRNVQGAAINPETGELWTHEHGAQGGDEINITRAGLNYGWPAVTYGINYNDTPISDLTAAPGIEEPVWYWRPSIAPSGMAFYAGDAFPEWQGDLFVGGLVAMQLDRFELAGDRVIGVEPLLTDLNARIRDVRTGPDGFLYLLTDAFEGAVLRIEPQG